MNGFLQKYKAYESEFECALAKRCAEMNYLPSLLTESMRYSLLLGGKRIRPVLFLSTLDAYGYDYRKEMDLALALECIHTYSLIHDDLPAMDNDDFRRGKASNHKAFGEANAILAGDALLSYAFDLMFSACNQSPRHIMAAKELSRAAGAEGMIAGQSADLYYSGKNAGKEELDFIYRNKTGKLLVAPIVMAGILAGGETEKLRAYGEALGYLFQLTDDLLDVKGDEKAMGKTLGKDEKEEKLTCVKVFGLKCSERMAEEYAEKCFSLLQELQGVDTSFMKELTKFVLTREI